MQTERLKVSGMCCDSCVDKVTRALQVVDGVKEVDVSLSAGQVAVQFDRHLTSIDRMKTAIERAGYGVEGSRAAPKRAGGGCCCH